MNSKDKTICLLVTIITGIVCDKALDNLYEIEKMKIEHSIGVNNCESK